MDVFLMHDSHKKIHMKYWRSEKLKVINIVAYIFFVTEKDILGQAIQQKSKSHLVMNSKGRKIQVQVNYIYL